MSRYWMLGASMALAIGSIGCDTAPRANYERLALVSAGGTVTLDGQPLVGAVVTFHDPVDETFSYGLTDQSGYFALQLDSVMPGVTPGTKVVRISTSRQIPGLTTSADGEDPDGPRSTEQVPDQYDSKTTLQVEVTPQQTRYDFHLKKS